VVSISNELAESFTTPTIPMDMPVETILRIALQRVIDGETLNESAKASLHVMTGIALRVGNLAPRSTRAQAESGLIRPQFEPVAEGFYHLLTPVGGQFVKVQRNLAGDRTYAKVWLPETKTWDYDAARGVLRKLRPDMELTPAMAKVFGDLYGQCVFCGTRLTDDRSISAGYGPKCAENRGLPWGEVADA